MNIQHENSKEKGRFYTEDNLAEITYTYFRPDGIQIEHTDVDSSLAGKGVGKQLVGALVNWARTNHIKVTPLCPFAKSLIEKKQEFQDVLFRN